MSTSEARLGANSEMYDDLKGLPEPEEPVVVAVYKFRDQTGQYKPSETGANWSTAVTQGATSILVEALEESGWFIPIEREGLSNLLNERKIIRSSRAAYSAENGEESSILPSLLFGGIILDGGIISYESNVLTGGAGLRYFGAGGSGQYREDRVSIYLRAVSTSNGRILKTIHTSKTILSQKVDAGIFRYVSLNRLLEAEVGFTFNEPAGVAVQEAIDKAVYAMIIEGILDNLWLPKDKEAIRGEVVTDYLVEKERNERTDYLGLETLPYRSNMNLGVSTGAFIYDGDYPNSAIRPMGEIHFGIFQDRSFSADLGLGIGQLATQDYYSSIVQSFRLSARYKLYNHYKYTPYIQLGGGMMLGTGDSPLDYQVHFRDHKYGFLGAEIGYEFMPLQNLGVDISAGYNWMLSDLVDEMIQGKYNDFFWSLKLGVNFYLGN